MGEQTQQVVEMVDALNHCLKTEKLLNEVAGYLDPYKNEINGCACGDLARRVHEHLYKFDDNE